MNSSLQDYEVLKVVGSGSFGTCYKVRSSLTKEIFVWKAVDYGRMSEEKKKMLCNEVNMLSEINHPYIVKYFTRILHKETTTLYIIMEWCRGGDLSSVIRETYKLGKLIEEWYVWRVIYQLARALEHIHQEYCLAHRDIKGANVFLDSRGNVKLGDFGLSCYVTTSSSPPEAVTVGTLHYVSPELLKGAKYSFKSDIWAFGCLVYEMCALNPPFHGVSVAQIISNIKAGRFQRIPANYSESLNRIVDSMLTVSVEQRLTARVITRHPAVVANQVTSDADFASSSSSSSTCRQTDATSNHSEISDLMAEIKLCQDPRDVSKRIFKDKWLAKLESVRSREAKLREKADKLVEREHSLDRREKRLVRMEREVKEKVARAQVYLNTCKEPKNPSTLKELSDETYATLSPDHYKSKNSGTVAKLDPTTLPKLNFAGKQLKHVHFQSNRPNTERNSAEISYFQVRDTTDRLDKQTTFKGLRYSSCQIVKNNKENNPATTKTTIKRNSFSRLSVRSSNIFI